MTIDTVCIPTNDDPIPLISISPRLAALERSGSYVSTKYNIQLVPDLPQCTDWDEKDWNIHNLIDLGDMDEQSKHPGPYLMFKSYSEDGAGRPPALHKHFLKLANAMNAEDPSPTYENLDKSSIDSAFNEKNILNREY